MPYEWERVGVDENEKSYEVESRFGDARKQPCRNVAELGKQRKRSSRRRHSPCPIRDPAHYHRYSLGIMG